jgi:hypothetical protein
VNDYPKKKFKTAKDWHLFHVYNDPEFKKDIAEFEIKYKKIINSRSKDYKEGFVPDWLQLTIDPKWDKIKNDYYMDSGDILYYLKGQDKQGYFNAKIEENMGSVYLNEREGTINIRLLPFVSAKS